MDNDRLTAGLFWFWVLAATVAYLYQFGDVLRFLLALVGLA